MNITECLTLEKQIREQFPKTFALRRSLYGSDTKLYIRMYGDAPQNPTGMLYQGPGIWIDEPSEWPAALEAFKSAAAVAKAARGPKLVEVKS